MRTCTKCPMQVCDVEQLKVVSIRYPINGDDGFIYWNRDLCYFYNFKRDLIDLPWLPFDITEDQLKLYLTFL